MDTTQKLILQNEIRLLEKDKKKIQEELNRLEETKNTEFLNYQSTLKLHKKELLTLQLQIERLRDGFNKLKLECEKAATDLMLYNENELIQTQRKTREMFETAQAKEKEILIREEALNSQDNAVKIREMSVEAREHIADEKTLELVESEKSLKKQSREIDEKVKKSEEILSKNEKNRQNAVEMAEIARKSEEISQNKRILIEQDIEKKKQEVSLKESLAQQLIKQYTTLLESMKAKEKELNTLKIQLDDRQETLQRAIKEWQTRGVNG